MRSSVIPPQRCHGSRAGPQLSHDVGKIELTSNESRAFNTRATDDIRSYAALMPCSNINLVVAFSDKRSAEEFSVSL